MNQEKIGKFISDCRKKKGLTQSELAEKLGVSDRTIGNWENGRNMPDLSLLKPLCKILDITLNDILSGEIVTEEKGNKYEKNIENTINYSQKLLQKKDLYLGLTKLIFGLALCLAIFNNVFYRTENHLRAFIFLFGTYFSASGLNTILKSYKSRHRILIILSFASALLGCSFAYDYQKVKNDLDIPIWFYELEGYYYDILIYKTPLYNYYVVHYDDGPNAYTVFDAKKEYTPDTLKIYPFTPESSLQELQKCSNDTECLLDKLPVFQKDAYEDGKTIFRYEETSINAIPFSLIDIKAALIYDALMIYLLTDYDELEFQPIIEHTLDELKYTTTRKAFENDFPSYRELKDNLNADNFENYVEENLKNEDFVKYFTFVLFKKDKIYDLSNITFEG